MLALNADYKKKIKIKTGFIEFLAGSKLKKEILNEFKVALKI